MTVTKEAGDGDEITEATDDHEHPRGRAGSQCAGGAARAVERPADDGAGSAPAARGSARCRVAEQPGAGACPGTHSTAQIARVNRGVPRGNGEVLFCELPDGTRGTLPSWMTNAAACAVLTVGKPVVAITALQELRVLLDALARGSDLPDVSMPSKEGGEARFETVDSPTKTPKPPVRHSGFQAARPRR